MLGEVGHENSNEDETVVDIAESLVWKIGAHRCVTNSDKMKLKLTP